MKRYYIQRDSSQQIDLKNINEYQSGQTDNYHLNNEQIDYPEQIYVISSCDDELVLKSRQNKLDGIYARKTDEQHYSFKWNGNRYKIYYRSRLSILCAGFDFVNTVQTNLLNFISIRQINNDDLIGQINQIDLVSLCDNNVRIESDSIKIIMNQTTDKFKNIYVSGHELCISNGLSGIHIEGDRISVNQYSKNVSINGNDILVGDNCQNIQIGNDCQFIDVGNGCKDIYIRNICQKIRINDGSQNINIGNSSQNVSIGKNCGLNSRINIGFNCGFNGSIFINDSCGNISIDSDCAINGKIKIDSNCANDGLIRIQSQCAQQGQIIIGEGCGSEFGSITISQKSAQNGNIIISNQCGSQFGSIFIHPMCAQSGGQIYLGSMSGSGKKGLVQVDSRCANNAQINVDIGQGQKLFIQTNSCTLKNTNDFNSADFIYCIKKNISAQLCQIPEYTPCDNQSQYVDMFDRYKNDENFKIRI